MKFFTKTMALAFTAAVFLAAPGSVKAVYCASNDACYDPCEGATFSFGADFLWLKPCVLNMDYAAASSVVDLDPGTATTIDYHNLKTKWEPGVRVYFGMPDFYYDWNMKGSWTYFKAHDTETQIGANLLAPFLSPLLIEEAGGSFTTISADWSLEYHEFDFVFSVPFEFCHNHFLEPFFGANGLLIRQHLDIDMTNAVLSDAQGVTEWHSHSWGAGLIMGTHYEFYIDDGFKFHSKASASLLAGRSTRGDNSQELTIIDEAPIVFSLDANDDKKDCEFFPGLHIQTGLSYEGDMCGVQYGIHVGYEFKHWWNLPSARRFTGGDHEEDVAAHSSGDTTTHLGMHGLYAGLEFKF